MRLIWIVKYIHLAAVRTLITRGGNKARSTYNVLTMVGGAIRLFFFFHIAIIQLLSLQIICTEWNLSYQKLEVLLNIHM